MFFDGIPKIITQIRDEYSRFIEIIESLNITVQESHYSGELNPYQWTLMMAHFNPDYSVIDLVGLLYSVFARTVLSMLG